MIDMISMLHCIKFCALFLLFLLRLTFLFQYLITVVCFELTNISSDLFFLGYFIQRLKNLRQTSDLSRHCMLAILLRCILVIAQFDQ